MKGNGVSCFLGPGSYNDQNGYLKLRQTPCSSIMVRLIANDFNRNKLVQYLKVKVVNHIIL